jgi:hypothetical protein
MIDHSRHVSFRVMCVFQCCACPSDIYKIDRRVSRLRNFLLTGILPCTGFTFNLPEHQSYIYILLYCTATPRHYFI